MKTIAQNVKIHLFDKDWICSLHVGLYADSSHRPAIQLTHLAEEGWEEPFTTATTNKPDYIYGSPDHHTIAKVYSENEGLWEQLLELSDERGKFFRVAPMKVTVGGTTCHVVELLNSALFAYDELRDALAAKPHGRFSLIKGGRR